MIYSLGIDEEFTEIKKCERADIYEYFRGKPSLQLDLETTGGDVHQNRIISAQFGDRNTQFFVDVRNINILEFKELIESKQCVIHNSKFEYKFLKKAGIMVENIWDTMLAECVLYAGYDKWGYGLADLVRRYLGVEMEKETRSSFLSVEDRPFNERQIRYGCLDVTYLDDVKARQEVLLEEKELGKTLALENQVVKAFGDMEYNGMSFNPKAWMKICSQTQLEAQGLRENLDDIVLTDGVLGPLYKPEYVQGDLFGGTVRELDINYASPAQISEICTKLGFPTESTDEKHLTRLKGKHKFFSRLIELRKKNKVISTYGENFLKYVSDLTGRVHTSYWQVLETGRTSSGSKRDGTVNIQNLPRKGGFKPCFTSRPGYSWISSDYSGQEARLMASAAQDKGLMDILNSGKDIHSEVGTMMFKKPITKEDEEERYLAKTVNFMVPYGAASQKLADEMEISEPEAAKLLDLHAQAFPQLHNWLKQRGIYAKKYEHSITIGPVGRKRFYPDMAIAKELRRKGVRQGDRETWRKILIIEGQTQRNGGNTPIQGGAADMSKEALIAIRNLVLEYNNTYGEDTAFLIGFVHDSIEAEAKDAIAKQFGAEKNQIMVDVANKYLNGVVMKVDTSISKKWGK
jgi:DNA polymerase-1